MLFFPKLILQKDPNLEPSSSLIFIPLDVDLSLHAVPALVLLFDFMFLETKYSKKESRYLAPLIVLSFATLYGSWVEYCAKFNGTCMLLPWVSSCDCRFSTLLFTVPYPFLTDNPFNIRVGIYVGASAIALGSFWSLNALHSN